MEGLCARTRVVAQGQRSCAYTCKGMTPSLASPGALWRETPGITLGMTGCMHAGHLEAVNYEIQSVL